MDVSIPMKLVLAFLFALACALIVGLGHVGLESLFINRLGLPQAGFSATLVFLAFLLATVLWSVLHDAGQRTESKTVKLDSTCCETAGELESVRRFNDVLREHLNCVTEQTEVAATQMANRLLDIDAAMLRLDAFIGEMATRASGGDLEQVRQQEERVIESIRASSKELSVMFMEMMASLQFQDVTRQQVGQVADALHTLDGHADDLALRLRQGNDPESILTPLTQRLEEIHSRYVMERQRLTHEKAVRAVSAETTANVPDNNKVELF